MRELAKFLTSSSGLAVLCRAIEIASLRVEQAKALDVPPKLEDLLIDESWREALSGEFAKPYMRKLANFLSAEWQQQSVYPPQPLIFRCCPSAACLACSLELPRMLPQAACHLPILRVTWAELGHDGLKLRTVMLGGRSAV